MRVNFKVHLINLSLDDNKKSNSCVTKIAPQAHHPMYDAPGLSRNAMLSKAVVID